MTLPNITATGRLGDDPTLKFTPSGKAVTSFRIACDERRKDDGEWKTTATVWIGVSVWEDDAESAAHNLAKGDLVTVIGSLLTREYEHNGTTRTAVEIKYARISKALPKSTTSTPAAPAASAWNPTPQQGGGQAWGTQEPPF